MVVLSPKRNKPFKFKAILLVCAPDWVLTERGLYLWPLSFCYGIPIIISRSISRWYLYSKVHFISQVTCTDLTPNPLSVSSLFIVDVVDVNEAPCNLSISSKTIKENRIVGDEVGVFNVQDPDLPVGE